MALSLLTGAGTTTAEIVWSLRLPRTLATVLTGAAMGMAGLLMQLLVRNRFVEPSTVGTTEAAGAGLLAVTILAPDMPVAGKMLVAVAAALVGTALFLRVLRAIPADSGIVVVPLVGLMLSGVISAATTFVAYRWDLLQTLAAWTTGDFSGVVRGRYELLWLVGVMLALVWIAADRFGVASLGESRAIGLGLNYRGVLALGLTIVAITSAVCVSVIGTLPFLGLVVPNLASRLVGDRLRRALPLVAIGGAGLVVGCDLLARLIAYPFEVPVGIVVGVVGSAVFLVMLLRSRH